jgi:guanylate kinase
MSDTRQGRLVVISGPSGVGKSTVVRALMERLADRVHLSTSATTRPSRAGEQDGIEYHFLTDAEFARRREQGQFLECIEVFGRGHWYGTLWSEVRPSLKAGKWVILEIDVEGAQRVLRQFPEAITLFIRPDSLKELERRLRNRGTETEEAIERRLAVARRELELKSQYDHILVNITVDETVNDICNTLKSRGLRYD